MSIFVTIVGCILILCVVFFVSVTIYEQALNVTAKFLDRITWDAKRAERARIYVRMKQDSWWFSEDEKAMKALDLYAEGLQSEAYISSTREAWRKAFAAKDSQ